MFAIDLNLNLQISHSVLAARSRPAEVCCSFSRAEQQSVGSDGRALGLAEAKNRSKRTTECNRITHNGRERSLFVSSHRYRTDSKKQSGPVRLPGAVPYGSRVRSGVEDGWCLLAPIVFGRQCCDAACRTRRGLPASKRVIVNAMKTRAHSRTKYQLRVSN